MADGRPDNPRRRRWRTLGRLLAVAMAIVLAWPREGASWTSLVPPAVSPYIAVMSAIALRSVGLVFLLSLPVLVAAWWVRRWFCHYACPVGLCLELPQRLWGKEARSTRFPVVGRWVVAITFVAAILGYPLMLWLDPLAIFGGFLGAWQRPVSVASLVGGIGMASVLLLELLVPRTWCRCVCPLGATQDILFRVRQWVRRAFAASEPEQKLSPMLGRRGIIALGGGVAGALLFKRSANHVRPLRPPGAIDEARFRAVCVRCGNCGQVCPSRVIRHDTGGHGATSLLTPVLNFENDHCREDCHRCNRVCPSGAIARLTLEEKRKRILGLAKINLDTCLLAEGKECTACIRGCPFEAIVIQASEDGFSTYPRVETSKCNGCGACEAACPVRPSRAVRVG